MPAKEDVVKSFEKTVKTLARKLARKAPNTLEEGDLENAGFIGLLDAVERFDPEVGTSFSTYANIKIKGAMLDEMRKMDWAPRSIRERIKRLNNASRELKLELNRNPDEEDLAKKLGVSREDLNRMYMGPQNYKFSSIDDLIRGENGIPSQSCESPEEKVERFEEEERIFQAIRKLPAMERIVLALYYYFELTLKEIGEILGMGESRVCQIRSSAIRSLRSSMLKEECDESHGA